MTRGVCLGVAFSFFATELLQFASGFVWIIGLLFATWTARFVLRLALKPARARVPPPSRSCAAMPKIALVPGMKKAAAAMGVGAQAGALMAGKGAKVAARAAKGGAKMAGRTARGGSAGAGVVGGAGAAAAAAGARAGAAVGAGAAKGTVYGIVQGAKGGAKAGLAARDLVVKGTMTAGARRRRAAAAWPDAGKSSFRRIRDGARGGDVRPGRAQDEDGDLPPEGCSPERISWSRREDAEAQDLRVRRETASKRASQL